MSNRLTLVIRIIGFSDGILETYYCQFLPHWNYRYSTVFWNNRDTTKLILLMTRVLYSLTLSSQGTKGTVLYAVPTDRTNQWGVEFGVPSRISTRHVSDLGREDPRPEFHRRSPPTDWGLRVHPHQCFEKV